MNIWADLALIVGAYLFGSLPFMLALAQYRGIIDAKERRDLHLVLWYQGRRFDSGLGLFVDFAKGAIVVLSGAGLGFPLPVVAAAGVAVVCGQMWPVFLRFDGEKGNSTGLAVAVTLSWASPSFLPLLLALIPLAIGASIRITAPLFHSRPLLSQRLRLSLPLGMAIGFACLPVFSWWLGQPVEIIFGFLALFLVIIIRRLTAGVRDDLKTTTSKKTVMVNRLLYDRSYL